MQFNFLLYHQPKILKPIEEITQGITLQAKPTMLPGSTTPEDIPFYDFYSKW